MKWCDSVSRCLLEYTSEERFGFPAGKLDNFLLLLNLFFVHRTPVLLAEELAKSKKENSLLEIHKVYPFVFDAV